MNINMGAGRDIRKGWINLDNHDTFGANFIADLNHLPLALPDNVFNIVLCSQVLEHFNDVVPIMDELFRVCKKGGKVIIKVPYENHTWDSIDHKKCFNINSFYGYLNQEDFKPNKNNIKIESIKFYFNDYKPKTFLSFISKYYRKCWCLIANLAIKINKSLVDHTPLKNLINVVSIEVVYKNE